MKVRAYLASDEDELTPSKIADRSIILDSQSNDPEELDQILSLFFPDQIQKVGSFSDSHELKTSLDEQKVVYSKLYWQGPGEYAVWLPTQHRHVLRLQELLKRELLFFFRLEEHVTSGNDVLARDVRKT